MIRSAWAARADSAGTAWKQLHAGSCRAAGSRQQPETSNNGSAPSSAPGQLAVGSQCVGVASYWHATHAHAQHGRAHNGHDPSLLSSGRELRPWPWNLLNFQVSANRGSCGLPYSYATREAPVFQQGLSLRAFGECAMTQGRPPPARQWFMPFSSKAVRHGSQPPRPSAGNAVPAPASWPVNSAIMAPRVIVLQRGKPAAEMDLNEALLAAAAAETDLVQMPLRCEPPVAMLLSHQRLCERPAYAMDRLKLRVRNSRVKDLSVSCRTAMNDVDLKFRSLRRMLDAGDSVALTVEYKAGAEDAAAASRMELLLSRLREGGVGNPGAVQRPSRGKLLSLVEPASTDALSGYVEAAALLLQQLAAE
mmetsp:Transcript_22225/g.66280  ORF Transcript_22225/g.66280 Transcript_22225/m.66280 type:complete len:363 (-) Transcript_22225:2702-3790(-)